ncbi:GDP-mannose 4,6-dehydratase [Candidatus Levyibacteriota bacterium]|nr:SDR family oxidoreductase [Candidatus Levybacteria bacterium]GDX61740.1 GDP-mannose 4,6-dehydratase [Candidatus Levybacteria bacterium]
MQKVFITGASGFAGSHLVDYLISQKKYELYGTYLTERSLINIKQNSNKINLFQLDLQDQNKTLEIIQKIKPDSIYHLAAFASVGQSLENPKEVIINNITAELNLLEAIKKSDFKDIKTLIVTSADIYGKVSVKDIPIDEETPLNPTSGYAVSKIAQDYLALQYYTTYDIPIVRVRPFNHFGPRQSSGFVIADFAKKIVEIENGLIPPILNVGNLDSRRDFTDVRDMVRGYQMLLEKGLPGEAYNIGSGRSYKISEILNILISNAKLPISINVDSSLFRQGEAQDRVCDSTKFKRLTGWESLISLSKSLKDTLDYWRAIV